MKAKTITAIKSDYTGELFENKSKYKIHVQEQKRKIAEAEEKRIAEETRDRILNEPRLLAVSPQDFIKRMIIAVNHFKNEIENQLVSMQITELKFGDVSNSHSRPASGKQNFYSSVAYPKSYPGWNGEITFQFKGAAVGFSKIEKLMIQIPGFNTGNGSGNNLICQKVLRMYLDDFPLMKKMHEQHERLVKLKSASENKISQLSTKKSKKNVELKKLNSKLGTVNRKIAAMIREQKRIQCEVKLMEAFDRNSIERKNAFKHTKELDALNKLFK